MLQRAGQVLFHIDQSERLVEAARQQFDAVADRLPDGDMDLQAASPLVSAAIIEATAALSSLRVLQNEGWQLLCVSCDAPNAPASIHDAYSAIVRARAQNTKRPRWMMPLTAGQRDLVVAYWEASGKNLTAFRDVDQHHAVIATGCFVRVESRRATTVTIVLPDNPEAKSLKNFTYDRRLDFVAVLRAAFVSVHGLIETIAAQTGINAAAPLPFTFSIHPEIRTREGVEAPIAIIMTDYTGRAGAILGQTADRRVSVTPLA